MISVLHTHTIHNVTMKKTLFITGFCLAVLIVSAQNTPVATHQPKAADKAKKIEALMQQYYAYDQFSGVWLHVNQCSANTFLILYTDNTSAMAL